MRFACVQFDVQLGQRAANERRAEALLAAAVAPGGAGFILLPEMAFVGYCFRDPAEIAPFAEPLDDSPTLRWCAAMARRYGAPVAAGFVERAAGGALHNALAAAAPDGTLLHVHRKHILFEADKPWATPGPGFASCEIPGLGTCSFGICMDLNPRAGKGFADCAFARSMLASAKGPRRAAGTALVACNWLHPEPEHVPAGWTPQEFLLAYWRLRMAPLHGLPALLALANRTGTERGTRFGGCSCVLDLRSGMALGCLGVDEEGVLLAEAPADFPAAARNAF